MIDRNDGADAVPTFPPLKPFRLADQENLNRTLPSYGLVEDPATSTRKLALGPWHGTIELPDAEAAVLDLELGPPDSRWTWGKYASLFVSQESTGCMDVAGELWSLRNPAGACCVVVNGRPMQLRLFERSWEPRFVARVEGHVDGTSHFLGRIDASTEHLRDRLIRAVASVRLDR